MKEAVKITPISRWLYRVEVCKSGGFWVSVHDCPGIPWVDVQKYLPQPTDQRPLLESGVVQSDGVCEWCETNPRKYLAISDVGRQLICGVCAADVEFDPIGMVSQ